ncbi:uncharacterized protein PAC_10759 [Phialocephala subalpina]|uniref:Uncharacterized protein n=1 Tax=Phialocephala subalpina TaxID=576137 RepID=A0A1L7X772_9HELO|nr:uncharacterized protein PAC_10759 [Phialocephala subalpina]
MTVDIDEKYAKHQKLRNGTNYVYYSRSFLADGKKPNPNASNVKTTGYPQIVFVWIFGVFYLLAWSGLLVAYALEILHYKLRAKGLMIMNLTVQAALVLGNYTNAIAWANLAPPHDWTFCLFYTIWDFLELLFVYFFYIETRGPTLEELAKIFDGDSAEVAHLDMREVEKDIHLDHEPINEKQAVQANESTV